MAENAKPGEQKEIFLRTFDRCPNCHYRETVTRQAWEAVRGPIKETLFISGEQKITALIDPTNPATMIAPVGPCLIRYFDNCARCGLEYCVRAEVKMMPLNLVTSNIPPEMKEG